MVDCSYCSRNDMSNMPIYNCYGLTVIVDGGFLYIFHESGYKQVFEIEFCPKCGRGLRG